MAVLDVYSSSNFSFDIKNKEYCFSAGDIKEHSAQNGNIISVTSFPGNSNGAWFLRINVADNLYSRFSNITKIEFRGRARAKRHTSGWGSSPAVDGKLYAAYYSNDGSKLFQNQNNITLKDEWRNIKFDITDNNLSESLIRYSSSNQSYVISPGFYITNDSLLRTQDYEIDLTIKIYYQKPWYSLQINSGTGKEGTFKVIKVSDNNNNIVYNGNSYSYEEEFPESLHYEITAEPSDGYKFNHWKDSNNNIATTQKTLNIIKTLNDIEAFETKYTYSPVFSFEGYSVNLISPSTGDFGKVSLPDKKYENNSSAEIIILLNKGYEIKEIKIDNKIQENPNLTLQDNGLLIYTTPPITKSIEVEITFGLIVLTITPIEAENGTISPNTKQKIEYNNNSGIFTFQPKTGYILKDIKINNQLINWSQNYLTYQFKNVKQDYTIEPIFVKQIQLSPKSNQILYLGAKNNIQIKIL